ncbi:MAG: outer membrane lipoprotein-sorting protein [Gammaproteobacteria bacterium]
MNRGIMTLSLMIALALSLDSAQAAPMAEEIMRNNFFATKTQLLVTDATMVLINDKGQQRERKTTTLSKLQQDGVNLKLVVRFDAPVDVRGTTFLQIQHLETDDDMWIFLPALKKTRRLVANNKRDSFVGTDFSYGDILTLKPETFDHALIGSKPMNGNDCYVVESVPKTAALLNDIGYAKKISWIRQDNFMEVMVEYYDEDGQLYKTQTTADHKMLEAEPQRWIALRREMVNHQSQHKTIVTFNKTDTSGAIPDGAFTTRAIERE